MTHNLHVLGTNTCKLWSFFFKFKFCHQWDECFLKAMKFIVVVIVGKVHHVP